jgi:WH2 motif
MSKMPNMKLGGGGPDSGRNDLLKSIQQGKKLKKTVTVDKSKPAIGKVSCRTIFEKKKNPKLTCL